MQVMQVMQGMQKGGFKKQLHCSNTQRMNEVASKSAKLALNSKPGGCFSATVHSSKMSETKCCGCKRPRDVFWSGTANIKQAKHPWS